MNLYTGKMLFVDLTRNQMTTAPLKEPWRKETWDGCRLAHRYDGNAVSADVQPLSPKNTPAIMPGPLCGARGLRMKQRSDSGTPMKNGIGSGAA